MCSSGIIGEGASRGQPANTGSPGKMAVTIESGYKTAVNYHVNSDMQSDKSKIAKMTNGDIS